MSGIRAARRIVQAAQQVLRLAAQVVKHLVKQSVEHPVKHLVEVAVVPPPADPHIAAAYSAQAEHTVASVASASVTVPQTAVPVEVAPVALTAIAPEPYRNRSTDSAIHGHDAQPNRHYWMNRDYVHKCVRIQAQYFER